MRHLIIVAATAPKDFGIGHLPFDPWNELAKMLTKVPTVVIWFISEYADSFARKRCTCIWRFPQT
jgi:hypothetical protein